MHQAQLGATLWAPSRLPEPNLPGPGKACKTLWQLSKLLAQRTNAVPSFPRSGPGQRHARAQPGHRGACIRLVSLTGGLGGGDTEGLGGDTEGFDGDLRNWLAAAWRQAAALPPSFTTALAAIACPSHYPLTPSCRNGHRFCTFLSLPLQVQPWAARSTGHCHRAGLPAQLVRCLC